MLAIQSEMWAEAKGKTQYRRIEFRLGNFIIYWNQQNEN